MVIQKVSHFKGSAKRWVVVIVLVRGAGVASPPAPRSRDQSFRIVNERWSRRSDDQGAFEVEWFLEPDVLDPVSGVFVQGVDAKAVLLRVNNRQQFFAEENPLARTDQALEDRILNPLTEVFTGLRRVTEATASCGGRRGHVVGNQVKHILRSIVDDESDQRRMHGG